MERRRGGAVRDAVVDDEVLLLVVVAAVLLGVGLFAVVDASGCRPDGLNMERLECKIREQRAEATRSLFLLIDVEYQPVYSVPPKINNEREASGSQSNRDLE
jgi:hypothetical protein